MSSPRVGILGGTFDPIHLGHLDAASAARRALRLTEVRLLPARIPPHRPPSAQAPAPDRLAMTALAVADVAGVTASDLELRAEGPSYTSRTLTALAETGLQPRQLFFIVGTDAFADIGSWYNFPDVLDCSHFVVVSRPGLPTAALEERLPSLAGRIGRPADSPALAADAAPKIWLVDADTRAISSSDIRRRVAAGRSIDRLVHPAVAAYIARHHLYAAAGADAAS